MISLHGDSKYKPPIIRKIRWWEDLLFQDIIVPIVLFAVFSVIIWYLWRLA